MAQPQQPKFFDIEDYQTGKRYRVEAFAEDATYDEASEYLASLPEEELAQYEYNPGAPAASAAPKTKAPTPTVDAQPVEPMPLSAFEANEIQQTAPTVYTKSQQEIPELRDIAEDLFARGVRDPAVYNEAYRPVLEQYGVDPAGYQANEETIGMAIKRDAAIRARNIDPTGFIFGTANFDTGIVDPEAPETVAGSLINSAVKSAQNTGNAFAVGLPSLVASAVGADETAVELGDKYVRNQAAINYERPDAVGDLSNLTLGNAAQYGAEALGSLGADIATGGLAGFGVKALTKKAVKEVAEASIQRRVAEGIPLQVAENLAAREAARNTSRLVAGAVGTQSVATETGFIAGDTYRDTGTFSPVTTVIAGVLSGSLDSILPTRFLQNVGISGEVTRQAFGKSLGKALTEGAKTASIEGGTEALQTFIGNMPETWITGEMPDDILDQMANAFVQGAIGGGTIGATSAASTNDYRGPATQLITDREATIIAPEGRKNSKKYKKGLADATVRGQEIVDNIVGEWNNKPNVQVLDNFKNAGVDKDALGVYRGDGNIILNTEAIVNEAKARNVSPDTVMESVLFHEALGHYGLESLYRDQLDSKLLQFYNEGSTDFVRMVDSWIEQNPGAYTDSSGYVDIARAAEEVLAEMSEKGTIPRSMIDELINMLKDFLRDMGLNNTKLFKGSLQYSEREIRTIVAMGQAKVRDGEQADLNTGTPSDKYMYIGRRQLETNFYNNRETRLQRQLRESLYAIEDEAANRIMAAEPQDRQAIKDEYGIEGKSRLESGWFLGPDNKWRFEISDRDAYLKDLPSPGEVWSLDEALDHPSLYFLYKTLRKGILITTKDMPAHDYGGYNPSTNMITLNSMFRSGDAALRDRALETILHEVQHAIQEIEEFATGGNPEASLRRLSKNQLKKGVSNHIEYLNKTELLPLADALDTADEVRESPEYKAYVRAKKLKMEVMRTYRQAENRIKAAGGDPFNTKDQDFLEILDINSEASRAFAAAQKRLHALLGYPEYILPSQGVNSLQQAVYHNVMDALRDPEKMEKRFKRLQDKVKRFEDALASDSIHSLRYAAESIENASWEAYELLLGEVEARDVEARRKMTPEERRDVVPYTTQGKDPQDFLLSNSSGVYNSTDKYARPMRQNKKVEPLTIDELTAEDLFNSLNAYDIVKRVADNYVPTALSLDDLENEALLRSVPVSAVQKLSVNPGDFTVRMFQYDMVARKLNDKVAALGEKINSGRYTPKDKSDFLKAVFAFEDVTAKIFGLQSEYGRALRAIQEMEYTNKKVRTLRDALQGIAGEAAALDGLDDPGTFERFARSMTKRIQIKAAPAESNLGDKFASAINTPRAIMSSFDLSAPMRQGIFFIGRKEYYKAWSAMFSGVRAEQNYNDMMKDVMRSDYYPLMSVGKLFISSLDGDLSSREEAFQSNFAQNIPGVRRSEVAYAAFLNKLRTDLFTNYIKTFEDAGYELATKVDPKTGERVKKGLDELTEKEVAILKGLGNFINAGTGRGNLSVGNNSKGRIGRMLQSAGPLMNSLLFSPGLIASRIRLLNPVWYATLPAPVRWQAIKEAGKFFPGAAMTLGLINMAAQAMGEEEDIVEWDIRSSNFLKVNLDGVRYDVLGGMAQYMTLFAKGLIHSSNLLLDTEFASKKTSTGGLVRYEDDFRGRTFFDDVVRFSRYKASPMASFVLDFFDGKNAVGEPFTIDGAVADRMMPLYLQDLLDIAEEDGANAASFASAIPGFFGVGVSRYTPLPLDTEQELVAPDGWDDQDLPDGENSFVLVRDGKVILKPNAQRMYEKTVNAFFQELMQYEVASEKWPDLSPKEQAEKIEDVKRIARQETKKYISPLIGIEDAPVEQEEVVE